MSYCDPADVQAQLPARRFDATSVPSVEDVRRYITGRSAELDALLAERGIEVPVPDTATVARSWLRLVCAYGAGADAEAAGPNTTADTEGTHLRYLRSRWDTLTALLTSGDVTLPDAPRVTTAAGGTGRAAAYYATTTGTAWFLRGDVEGGRLDGTPPTPAW